jgi:hypothetical protein
MWCLQTGLVEMWFRKEDDLPTKVNHLWQKAQGATPLSQARARLASSLNLLRYEACAKKLGRREAGPKAVW